MKSSQQVRSRWQQFAPPDYSQGPTPSPPRFTPPSQPLKRSMFRSPVRREIWTLCIVSLVDATALVTAILSGSPWLVPIAVAGLGALLANLWLLFRHSHKNRPVAAAPFSDSTHDGRSYRTRHADVRYQRFSVPERPRQLFGAFGPRVARPLPRETVGAIATTLALVAALVLLLTLQNIGPAPYPRLSITNSTERLPAALSLGPPQGAAISIDEATQVTKAAWRTREQALIGRQLGVIRELETGTQESLDSEYLKNLEYGLEPPINTAPRPADAIDVFVPPPSMYTNYFAAAVNTSPSTNPAAATDLLVMTRSRAGSPWRISWVTGSQGSQDNMLIPQPLGLPEGWDGFDWFGNDMNSWLGDLAAYYTSWKNTGHAPVPDPFVSGFLTDQKGEELSARGQGSLTDDGAARQTYTFKAPPAADQWLLGYGGTGIMCGNIAEVVTLHAVSGGLVQDSNRVNWGAGVPPGSYRSIATTFLYSVCVYTEEGDPSALYVFGNENDVVGEQGFH